MVPTIYRSKGVIEEMTVYIWAAERGFQETGIVELCEKSNVMFSV